MDVTMVEAATASSADPLTEMTSLEIALEVLRDLRVRNVVSDDDVRRSLNNCSNKDNDAKTVAVKNKDKTAKTAVTRKAKKNKARPVKTHRRRPVALQVAYDGATHCGFTETLDPTAPPDDSVERHLFDALKKCCLIEDRAGCKYSRAGRTDRGVSAHGQVIGLTLKSALPLSCTAQPLPGNSCDAVTVANNNDNNNNNTITYRELDYPYILNNLLPPTIRVLGWCPVTPDFSARFSASGRLYRYFFVKGDLNLDNMRTALRHMVGRHDFRNLCKINAKEVYNFERVIHQADIVETTTTTTNADVVCYLQIHGQAFLWHQIRCVAAVLFLVGRGLEEPQLVTELLDVTANPRKPSYEMAPDRPLVLHGCQYENLTFGSSVKTLWNVRQHWRERWEELTLAAARMKDGMDALDTHAQVTVKDVCEYGETMFVSKQQRKRRQRNKSGAGADADKKRQKNSAVATTGSALDKDKKKDAPDDQNNGNDPSPYPDWVPPQFRERKLVTWGEALELLSCCRAATMCNHDNNNKLNHVPVMQRAKGTSYEEKLHAIMTTEKKRERYEEDVLSKRQTKAEDGSFYEHMARQGGSAWG